MVFEEQFASSRVLVVGDVALDCYVYGDVSRVSPEAPVPVLRHQSVQNAAGCAANVAANVAALGASATLVTLTGADAAADMLKAATKGAFRVFTVADPSRLTTTKTRYIASGQQIVRVDQEIILPPGAEIEDQLLSLFVVALSECDVVAVSDYNKGMLTDRVLKGIIDLARAAGKPVVVDPKRLTFESYRGATIVKPNRSELRAATGLRCETDEEASIAAQAAMEMTDAAILLTRSEQGMSLFRQGRRPVHCRTEARDVFDVSGAGDTVAAVVSIALAAGIDAEEAMRIANVAAGIVVGKRGTATVTAAELSNALARTQRGFETRVLSREAAILQRESWRRQGLTCGFTNGCFDLVHPGHISLLKRAKASCDRLIVALNSDSSVRRLKGPSRPLQDENARAYVLSHVEHVDGVVLFYEDTPAELIKALKPDVLIKGADYREDQVVGADLVRSWGGDVVLVNLVPEQSTTRLAHRASKAAAS